MNRQRLVLVALLGLLSLCVVYAIVATPRLEKAPPRDEARRVVKSSPVPSGSGPLRIQLEPFDAEPEPFPGAERDIFRFKVHRPAPPVTPDKKPQPVKPAVEVAPPPVMPVPVDVTRQALGRFTFLGFLEKSGTRTVFLSTEGELFVVKRGERFGKDLEFLVETIDKDLLIVQQRGNDRSIQIPLVENQSLKPTVSSPATFAPLGRPEPVPQRFNTVPRIPPPSDTGEETTENSIPGLDDERNQLQPGTVSEGEADVTNQ